MKFNKLSPLIKQQIPDYVFSDIGHTGETSLVTLLEHYYMWLEEVDDLVLEDYRKIPLQLVKSAICLPSSYSLSIHQINKIVKIINNL